MSTTAGSALPGSLRLYKQEPNAINPPRWHGKKDDLPKGSPPPVHTLEPFERGLQPPKKGGARRSRRTKNRVNVFFKHLKLVNGKVYTNTEIRRVTTNRGQRITGHNGRHKINVRRTFKKQSGFPWSKPQSYPMRRRRITRRR